MRAAALLVLAATLASSAPAAAKAPTLDGRGRPKPAYRAVAQALMRRR